jgi:hypothetical protein
MFLRFVVKQIDPDSRQPKGLFVIAHELLDSGILSNEEFVQLREILIWFNINLPAPNPSKPRHRAAHRAIFWFKADAQECISRIWEMAHLLEYHGYAIEMQKCRKLGNIVYEDKFQVAAFPSDDDEK